MTCCVLRCFFSLQTIGSDLTNFLLWLSRSGVLASWEKDYRWKKVAYSRMNIQLCWPQAKRFNCDTYKDWQVYYLDSFRGVNRQNSGVRPCANNESSMQKVGRQFYIICVCSLSRNLQQRQNSEKYFHLSPITDSILYMSPVNLSLCFLCYPLFWCSIARPLCLCNSTQCL